MFSGEGSRRGVLARMGFLAMMAGAASAVARHAMSALPPTSRGPWTPFLANRDAVIVTATLLGERLPVLIDTGSAVTVVDRVVAKRLGLTVAGSVNVRGDIGSVALGAGGDLSLHIGGMLLAISRYLVTDFAPIFGADGGAPGLILGVDALKNVILEIDFPGRRVSFPPRERFQPGKEAERLQLSRSVRGQLSITIAIEGHDPVAAAVDLGSSNPLTVASDLAEAQALLRGRKISSAATGGVDGISISRSLSVATLKGLSPQRSQTGHRI